MKLYQVVTTVLFLIIISCTNKQTSNSNIDSITIDTAMVDISEKNITTDTIFLEIPKKPTFINKTREEEFSNSILLNQNSDRLNTLEKNYYNAIDSAENGKLYLKEKQFSGDNVPFVCYVSKEIKSFYIDNKKVKFTPEKEFFFRQKIELYLGYNRIPVRIVNKKGFETEAYIEINMEKTQ